MRNIKFILPVLLLVIVAGLSTAYRYFSAKNKILESGFLVERSDVAETVALTGKTKPASVVDLGFETNGRVSKVYVSAGDKVLTGDSLVELDTSELRAELLEASANLDAAKAVLEEVRRGARTEEINIKETELRQAEQDLANDYGDAVSALNDAYTKSDDVILSKTAGIFIGSPSSLYELTYDPCNIEAAQKAAYLRLAAEDDLQRWRNEIFNLSVTSSEQDLDSALSKSKIHLALYKDTLEAINATLVTSCTNNKSNLDFYRTNINSARATIATLITAINNEGQKILSDKLAVEKIKSELDLKLAGSSREEIITEEAKTKQAEARLALIEAQIAKTIIRTPFSGLVTRQEVEVGEIVSPQAVIVSVISENNMEIETNIPEVDIGKVAEGNNVRITLDAFQGEDFFGRVVYIDPAETVIDGVQSYKAKIVFNKDDSRFKSGLTANLKIETVRKTKVIAVPIFSLLLRDGFYIAKKIDGRSIIEVPVTLGTRGEGGIVEVLSGLVEGDRIINANLSK